MSLFSELQRRKVIRVGIAYLAFAWALIQIAETLLPVYGFSDAAIRILVAILAVGLIPVLVIAWVFEWSSGGIRKTAVVEGEPNLRKQRWQTAILLLLVISATVLASYLTIRGIDESAMPDHAIAILPFQNLGAAEADMFTDGMHVGVITRLSNLRDFDVISRTSVLKYSESDASLPDIASELGAKWVLRADVQQVEGDVLVSAQLADARGDRQVWAEEYRRTLTASNIFEIQAEISRRIIDALEARLTPREASRIGSVPTESLEAYRFFQQGRVLLDQRTPEGMQRSIGYFERALEVDDGYALAWVGLADSHVLLHAYHYDTRAQNLVRAEEAIARAIKLDDGLAEAYASRAMLHYVRRNGPGAIRDIDRAVQLRPSYAQAYTWRNFFYTMLGEIEEGAKSLRRAVALDPLNAEAVANLSGSYASTGQFEQALAEAQRVAELAPGWSNAMLVEGQALYLLGRFEEAVAMLEGVSVPWTGAGAETALARAYIALGQRDAAHSVLAQIEASGDTYSTAIVRAALGNMDEAYAALFAFDGWEGWQTINIRYDYRDVIDPSRNDPRYLDLIRKINKSWSLEAEGLQLSH